MITRYLILSAFFLFNLNWAYSQTAKTAVLWIDPLLNIKEITTRAGITKILNNAKISGFQALALGVKTTTGHVLYKSKIAPQLLEWEDYKMPLDFDLIKQFITDSRAKELQFYAVYPMFSEGNMIERIGTLYSQHSEWQSSVYVVENDKPQIIPITQWAYGTVAYANPLNTAVQNYQISIIQEFLEEYTVDGIIFDKARFYGIETDFSDESRTQFETFLGSQKVDWWPDDIFQWQFRNDQWEIVPGKRFHEWIEFRAKSIQGYFTKVINAVKEKDPSLPIGNFVGSWYPTYYEYGVNWASEKNIPEEDWAPREYNQTAIAEKLNYTVVGCFFPRVTMAEAETEGADWWMSVEGGTTIAMEVIDKATPVYGAILVEQFKSDKEKFKESIKMTLNNTDGLFITDLSQVQKYNYWSAIASVLMNKDEELIRE